MKKWDTQGKDQTRCDVQPNAPNVSGRCSVATVATTFTKANMLPTAITGILCASTKNGAKNAPYRVDAYSI